MIKHERAEHKKRQLRLYHGKENSLPKWHPKYNNTCTFALFNLLKLTSNAFFYKTFTSNYEHVSNKYTCFEMKKFVNRFD